MAKSEVRLVAIARDVDGAGDVWYRPFVSVEWGKAWERGITEEEAEALLPIDPPFTPNPPMVFDHTKRRDSLESAHRKLAALSTPNPEEAKPRGEKRDD